MRRLLAAAIGTLALALPTNAQTVTYLGSGPTAKNPGSMTATISPHQGWPGDLLLRVDWGPITSPLYANMRGAYLFVSASAYPSPIQLPTNERPDWWLDYPTFVGGFLGPYYWPAIMQVRVPNVQLPTFYAQAIGKWFGCRGPCGEYPISPAIKIVP